MRLWRLQEIEQPPHIFMPANSPPRDRVLSHEEVGRLIDAAPMHIALYVRLALCTAARPSDLLRLTWFQVDLLHRRIHMMKHGEVASNKRKGVVGISEATAELLESVRGTADDSHVIAWRGKSLTARSLHQAIVRAAKRAGIDGVYPYALRHTAATWLARDNVSMHDIAQLLGHSTTRVTERYAKHSPDFMVAATSSMDRQLSQAISTAGRSVVSLQFRASKNETLKR